MCIWAFVNSHVISAIQIISEYDGTYRIHIIRRRRTGVCLLSGFCPLSVCSSGNERNRVVRTFTILVHRRLPIKKKKIFSVNRRSFYFAIQIHLKCVHLGRRDFAYGECGRQRRLWPFAPRICCHTVSQPPHRLHRCWRPNVLVTSLRCW